MTLRKRLSRFSLRAEAKHIQNTPVVVTSSVASPSSVFQDKSGRYNVKWSVTEIIDGPGRHDDGVRDGNRNVVASGEVVKEGSTPSQIRAELMEVLTEAFPRMEYGPTYNIDRVYDINITVVE